MMCSVCVVSVCVHDVRRVYDVRVCENGVHMCVRVVFMYERMWCVHMFVRCV